MFVENKTKNLVISKKICVCWCFGLNRRHSICKHNDGKYELNIWYLHIFIGWLKGLKYEEIYYSHPGSSSNESCGFFDH